jgi:thiamine-phosphate pyrophosphorylase
LLRYYITDRRARSWSIEELLACIARNIAAGVDYVQIREKDLPVRDLLDLTARAVEIAARTRTRIFVNDRADIALAASAHGVHLRSNSVSPDRLRSIFPPPFLIGASCHSIEDVQHAQGADLIVFGPVFESPGKGPPAGLAALTHAAGVSNVPVLALGGVNKQNTRTCVEAGAAGIAAIRLFQK